jgi:hypothetical protein
VLWLCLGVGLWHLLRSPSAALAPVQLWAAVPALTLSAVAGGPWPWLGLVPVILSALPGAGRRTRVGLLIILLAAAHEIAVDLLGELSGDALLAVDARIAGVMAGWFLPAVSVDGNALQQDGGHMLVLVWGCSSLTNLGDALLMYCALVSLYDADAAPAAARQRFFYCMLAVGLSTVALNATRLGFMSSSVAAYNYLHGSDGAAWFRVATLSITAAMSWVAVRR